METKVCKSLSSPLSLSSISIWNMIIGSCRAFVYEGFLTDEECDHLISLVNFLKLLPFLKFNMVLHRTISLLFILWYFAPRFLVIFFRNLVWMWFWGFCRRNRSLRDRRSRIMCQGKASSVKSELVLECLLVRQRLSVLSLDFALWIGLDASLVLLLEEIGCAIVARFGYG